VSFVRRTYLQLGSADEGRGTRNAEKDASRSDSVRFVTCGFVLRS
jgi:hypothetical protein